MFSCREGGGFQPPKVWKNGCKPQTSKLQNFQMRTSRSDDPY